MKLQGFFLPLFPLPHLEDPLRCRGPVRPWSTVRCQCSWRPRRTAPLVPPAPPTGLLAPGRSERTTLQQKDREGNQFLNSFHSDLAMSCHLFLLHCIDLHCPCLVLLTSCLSIWWLLGWFVTHFYCVYGVFTVFFYYVVLLRVCFNISPVCQWFLLRDSEGLNWLFYLHIHWLNGVAAVDSQILFCKIIWIISLLSWTQISVAGICILVLPLWLLPLFLLFLALFLSFSLDFTLAYIQNCACVCAWMWSHMLAQEHHCQAVIQPPLFHHAVQRILLTHTYFPQQNKPFGYCSATKIHT